MADFRELCELAKSGDLNKLILQTKEDEEGSYITSSDEDVRTLFHWSCACNQLEVAQWLCRGGANINHQDDEGWSPLHSSCSAGHTEIARFLISQNANVHLKTGSNCTALHYAAAKGHFEIVKLLLEAGSAVDEVDKYGNTPLMRAVSAGYVQLAECFLDNGASCTVKDKIQGDTILHIAVRNGDGPMCLLLCTRAQELLLVKNNDEMSPYRIAGDTVKKILKEFVVFN